MERFYWVYVPLVWALRLGLPSSFTRRVMTGEMIVDADPFQTDLPILHRWSDELPHADDARRPLCSERLSGLLSGTRDRRAESRAEAVPCSPGFRAARASNRSSRGSAISTWSS